MIALVAMTILISLSDLFGDEILEPQNVNAQYKKYPIYKAVLVSLIYPLVTTIFVLFIKYVTSLKLNINDWSMAYFLIFSLVLIPISIIHFLICGNCFSTKYFVQGFIASLGTAIASTLADNALALKDAPQGPTVAV